MKEKSLVLSYYDERACLFCYLPIADQEHATRKFCHSQKDEHGKVKDCKTTYHRKSDQPDREIYSAITNNHKATRDRIVKLIVNKGTKVTTADLDAYDILLQECVSFEIKPNGEQTSIFLDYTIISNPINHLHKINHYEQL